MRLYAFSTEGITRKITGAISEIESFGKDRVILTNPSASAEFPLLCCAASASKRKFTLMRGATSQSPLRYGAAGR